MSSSNHDPDAQRNSQPASGLQTPASLSDNQNQPSSNLPMPSPPGLPSPGGRLTPAIERFAGMATERTRLLTAPPPESYWTDGDGDDASDIAGPSSYTTSAAHRNLDIGRFRHHQDESIEEATPLRKNSAVRVAKTIRRRSKYYVPVTSWLPQYNWNLFGGDVVAGISVACLLVPQAMSYASGLAKLTPVAGLWATALPSLVYGALGTCRQMSMGPEASLSLVMGQLMADIVYMDPHSTPDNPMKEAIAVSVIATLQVGFITTGLGLLRLGFLDVVLSRALLRGFLTAIGFIIMVEQLFPLLGLQDVLRSSPDPPTETIPKLIFVIRHIQQANIHTALLSIFSVTFLIAARIGKQVAVKRPGGEWLRYIPHIFILVVTTTILSSVFRWDQLGIQVVGKVEGGASLPLGSPITPRTMKYFHDTLPTAFVMAIVGVVDSMVAAKENAAKYGYPVSPNRELVALGASNLMASCITVTGTLPIFGSLTRSRLNGQTGARTQMSSLVTAFLMILSACFLLPYLEFLPRAVLAAIITLVVFGLLEEAPHDTMFFYKMGAWTDMAQMIGTFLLTLLFSVEIGVISSVCFSLLLVIQRTTQPRIKIIARRPDSDKWEYIDDDDNADGHEEIPGVLVVRIREPLSFANTGQLKERLRRLELYGSKKSHPSDAPRRNEAKALILHMGDVDEIDASALQILDEIVKSYHERGVGVYFAHLRPKEVSALSIVGIPQLLGPTHFHPDLRSAMKEIESLGYSNITGSRYV